MGANKSVQIMFLSGGLLLFVLSKWTMEWVWGYFTKHPDEWMLILIPGVIALVAGIIAYKNDRLYGLAHDVAGELKKVTWPTRKETQAATVVVIVTVIIAAIILGLFDALWSKVTDTIYG